MSQPQAPRTRQSGPEAKVSPDDALHATLPGGKPGGPLMPSQMGYENPGATPNLRGVEENTNRSKGEVNPEQVGTDIRHGDHNPGYGQSGMTYEPRVPMVSAANERTADKSTKAAPPEPDPRGVCK